MNKHLLASSLVLLFTVLWVDVAEGRFLASTHSHLSATVNVSAVSHVKGKSVESEKGKGYLKETSSPQYPWIHRFHKWLEMVFAKHTQEWYHDWKLWVGITLWLSGWAKWYKYGYGELVYYQQALFTFGINILILHHLQYAETIKIGMLGVASFLAMQSMLQSFLWFKGEEHDKLNEQFECDTLYLDLSLPIEQIAILFIAQCCVWWFYMTTIAYTFHLDHVNYMFWAVAYLSMQMTMIFNRGPDSVLGNAFPVHEVYRLLLHTKAMTLQVQDSNAPPFRIAKENVLIRGILGFLINSICREIMAYTIPLMLMGFSQPMDFVVYCLGVNFICTIDDMTGKTFLTKGHAHLLAVDDIIIAKWPDFREGHLHNPWFAGKVIAIDTEFMRCTIRYEEGGVHNDVLESEVRYAPTRDPKFRQGNW